MGHYEAAFALTPPLSRQRERVRGAARQRLTAAYGAAPLSKP